MTMNSLHIIPFTRHFVKILPCLLLFTISACTDYINYPDNADVPEGEPATVSIGVEVKDMNKVTRADGNADYNRVASLWVGIFNSNSGEMTGGGMMTEKDNGFEVGNDYHTGYTLSNIKTLSGQSYIVGVANPENYNAITEGNTTSRNLKDILEKEVKDWNSYKSIVITETRVQNNAVDIQAPTVDNNYGLIMSGIYAPEKPTHPVSEEKAVTISPNVNKLNGAIHLRLLQSHIKFNLQAKGNVVELTPQSYQVHNIPSSSWLHEHVKPGEILNSGDALLGNKFDKDNNPNFYGSSLRFTSTSFTKEELKNEAGENITSYTFDFWQMENKREGLDDTCKEYQDREKEYGKNGEYDPTGTTAYEPSGLFMSLTPFENPTLNNMATYVDIPCVVKYREKTTEGNAKPGQITSDPDNLLDPGATRTANITYRIHLGYVNPDKNPKDFNTYRNSDYTYNVTVSDLHNVIVEAFRVAESQPGGFGDVTDVSDKFFTLDAHYGVFNIYLSEDDLKNFSFRMVSYEDNAPHEIIMGAPDKTDTQITDENRKYYNWITLLPTNSDDQSILAAYPGDGNEKLLHLEDFLPKKASRQAGYYTVFVNEYVYEDNPNEIGENWKSYVNQPDRMLWINVAQKTSADGESVFYKAKYAVAQHSIQTYYNTQNSTEAIGVEHENENFGMNLRWTRTIPSQESLNANNGRYNVWHNLPQKNKTRSWSDVVTFSQVQHVNGIDNAAVQSYITENQRKGEDKYLPLIKLLSKNDLQGTELNNINNGSSFTNVSLAYATNWDPQTNPDNPNVQYVQAMYSCMNRNRDEDGDGIIDESELKWYLPASGKYLRIILGRNSLATPIMTYKGLNLPYAGTDRVYDYDGIYHLISSDDKLIWADQGMSSSRFAYNDPYTCAPWQVRCIRNLGTNLNSIESGDDVSPAYTTYPNGTGAVVRVTNYYGTSLRNPSEVPLPLHKTNSEYNRLGRYGFEVAYRGNNATNNNYASEASFRDYNNAEKFEEAINNASPCETLNKNSGKKGWRIPNQKELAIMLRFKYSDSDYMLKFNGSYTDFYASCTSTYWDNLGVFESTQIQVSKYKIITCIENTESHFREMAAQSVGLLNWVRCVRDLQPGEYPELK